MMNKVAVVMPAPIFLWDRLLPQSKRKESTSKGKKPSSLHAQLAEMLAEKSATVAANALPATPSGMKPPYEKPTVKSRRKRPGCKEGHPGSRRPPPERIDQREEHRLKRCPECGGSLKRCHRTRTRYTEDIPHIQPVVTEHTIHRDWCPNQEAGESLEPVVPDALPGSTLGNHVLVLAAWLHYGLGNTLSQIVEVFNFHLQMKLTPAAWTKSGNGCRRSSTRGTNRFNNNPCTRRYCSPTRAAGESTGKRTGCGALRPTNLPIS